jgi:hypothetical protein
MERSYRIGPLFQECQEYKEQGEEVGDCAAVRQFLEAIYEGAEATLKTSGKPG